MEPIELKIGNLFHPINRTNKVHLPMTTTFFKVCEIGNKIKACLIQDNPAQLKELIQFDYKDISPVVIDSSLLRDYGFVSDGMFTRELKQIDNNNQKVLMIDHYENGWLIIWPWMQAGLMIKYMHQLQNLWYSITEKELETINNI